MAISPTIFRTAGLMVGDRPGNVPVTFDQIRQLGYRYVSPQGCNGAKLAPDGFKPGSPDWNQGLRPYGDYQQGLLDARLQVIPWQKLYGGSDAEVRAEADAAAEFIFRYRPSGFMANPEGEYKQDGAWRSAVYVDGLLAGLALRGVDPRSLLWAMLPLGAASPPNHFTFDVAAWLRLPGCWCIPEAYWATGVEGAGPEYRPLTCADEWLGAHGWPVERFAFLFGWWNGLFPSAADYFKDLDLVKQHYPKWQGGISIFKVEQMTEEVIGDFAKGIGRYAAAEVTDTPPAPAPTVDPAECNRNISREAHRWLDQFPLNDTKPVSRLRIIDRIARSTDAQWTTVDRAALAALLDKAGIPKT